MLPCRRARLNPKQFSDSCGAAAPADPHRPAVQQTISSSFLFWNFVLLNILVVLCCLSSDLVETTAFDLDCLFVTLVERRRFRNTTRVGLNSISTLLTNAHPQSTIRHQVIQIITKRVQSWHRNQECNNNNNNNNKWGIVRGMVNIEGILARLEMTGPGRMHQLEQQPQHPP